jgi:citrate lyase subunit beta/citryl-CoA lyase
MGGKLCIHPTQLPIVNETFSAGPDRVRWAQRVIAAHTAAPQGVSMLDGEMVDEAVVATARRVLASQE